MGIRTGAWREKGGLQSEGRKVPRRRGRERKESFSSQSRRKHERVNGRKSSQRGFAESWFLSKSGHLKWERRLGDEESAHKMAKRSESG